MHMEHNQLIIYKLYNKNPKTKIVDRCLVKCLIYDLSPRDEYHVEVKESCILSSTSRSWNVSSCSCLSFAHYYVNFKHNRYRNHRRRHLINKKF